MIKIYNSLTKKVEDFKPIHEGTVSMYTCGPTVYSYAHIGNFRTYVSADIIYRTFLVNDYKVRYIINLTDVGHLSDDADDGDDKVEKMAKEEGKSARDITDFYIKRFLIDYEKLRIIKPKKFTRATEYIKEQVSLVSELEKRGYTYRTSDGVYFDTSRFEKYGELSGHFAEDILEGARVEINPEKRNPTDFALWKLSPKDEKRWQEWESPWGIGFPGWHIECSAMALKELGQTIDVHLGGEDLLMHHQNEIAQSECATGKEFVHYWMHAAFLKIDGGKMSKSLNNMYTLEDIEAKGFDPLSLRYFYLSGHYRTSLNFTWEALQSAQTALKKLYQVVEGYSPIQEETFAKDYLSRFMDVVNNDFNMPQALATMWDLLKSDVSEQTKICTLLKMDEVLGLDIESHVGMTIPEEIVNLAETRNTYRRNGIWDKADQLRKQLEASGYLVEDRGDSYKIRRRI
ncbi:cysteine--tRNA ligase [Candidatus Nomurabacteria bacterium]|uniref:Cysteine--tRNA ligase n=1 Tax=candidate division WWE3 bacterium TaxID=2053526 RepID=A0A955IVY9_UNCKA|nr:cysteine--tRNA ligase [candidate division WWE3 bacterium]MCB9823667.1 cysteine--tRNA ligase [Candidatus Nomurabacteria bacterium]MCB9827255.1 cysteine--tRNA ligase [Candidatus Nomurabacteria bacterium]MCB9827462.1 cysteine--tRNA ligase [Candidatus Nomurabacteria bacterium]